MLYRNILALALSPLQFNFCTLHLLFGTSVSTVGLYLLCQWCWSPANCTVSLFVMMIIHYVSCADLAHMTTTLSALRIFCRNIRHNYLFNYSHYPYIYIQYEYSCRIFTTCIHDKYSGEGIRQKIFLQKIPT